MRSSAIPQGWRQVHLSDISTRVERRVEGLPTHVLMISSRDGFIPQNEKYSRFMAGESVKKYIALRRGEFAYNRGNSLAFPQGCIYQLQDYESAAVPHVYFCFALTSGDVSDGFLAHLFLAGTLNAQLERRINSGVRNNGLMNIRPESFFGVQLLLPPLNEQQKIAAILTSLDETIKDAQAVIDQLLVVKRAMVAKLLTRGMPALHSRSVGTEIGDVPAGWVTTTVGDLGRFTGGNGFRPSDWSREGLPIIRIQNLNGSSDFNYYSGRPDPAWLVEPGELLFAWAGSRGASFGPCIWPGPLGVLNQHIYRISPGDSVRKKYLYYVLRLITEEVERKAHGFKDTLVHLRKAELTGWTIALPPLDEQDQIISILTTFEDRIRSEEESLSALRSTKAALASALLSGELRVTPDEAAP